MKVECCLLDARRSTLWESSGKPIYYRLRGTKSGNKTGGGGETKARLTTDDFLCRRSPSQAMSRRAKGEGDAVPSSERERGCSVERKESEVAASENGKGKKEEEEKKRKKGLASTRQRNAAGKQSSSSKEEGKGARAYRSSSSESERGKGKGREGNVAASQAKGKGYKWQKAARFPVADIVLLLYVSMALNGERMNR